MLTSDMWHDALLKGINAMHSLSCAAFLEAFPPNPDGGSSPKLYGSTKNIIAKNRCIFYSIDVLILLLNLELKKNAVRVLLVNPGNYTFRRFF